MSVKPLQVEQGQRLKFLLQTLDITQQELAAEINVSQSAISQMVKGKSAISLEAIVTICTKFNVDCNWLIRGMGQPFLKPGNGRSEIIPVTVDSENNPNIVLVPVKAQAGYALGRLEEAYFSELPAFNLPMQSIKQGTYRAFEVDGDSMEPSLYKGDIIVCQHLDDWRWLRDFHLYVFVVEGDVLVKRVQNRLRSEGVIDLLSDNRFYPPLTLRQEEIVEVWKVYARITLQFPSPTGSLRELAGQLQGSAGSTLQVAPQVSKVEEIQAI